MEISQAAHIKVETGLARDRLEALGVFSWPVWTKDVSTFPWTYDDSETCYFLAGEVVVTPEGGSPVTMGQGDLVTFPAGMSCRWEIRSAVKKHYSFG
ncbi:MAG: cupin domain-containing protein [Leptolyngbya sp. SIO1E4]|nr:cupin domain-containing protein [Leptolyngbya sp. SIO1E4]